VRYEWESEKGRIETATVTLSPVEKGTNLGQEIIAHVPSLQAQLGVLSAKDVAAAASVFCDTEGFYIEHVRYRQTGWRKDGSFGFPGDDTEDATDVDGSHMRELAGYGLLRFPGAVDTSRLSTGAHALLEAASCAPERMSGLLLGTVLAAPIYREADHLAARGFIALAVGPTQAGKTTLVSRLYCLLGAFYSKPSTLETWFSTAATLEQPTHFFRDLPVFIDDFRDTNRDQREAFRTLAMAIGNAAARGRATMGSGGLRVSRRFRPQCLVIATGEHAPEDDGGEEARVLEVDASRGIDSQRLLAIDTKALDAMPHLYRDYIEWCGRQSKESWVERRAAYRLVLNYAAGSGAVTRGCENATTAVMGLVVFREFIEETLGAAEPALVERWLSYVAAVGTDLPRIVKEQTERIVSSRIDGLVLAEVARGARAGEVIVSPLSSGKVSSSSKLQLGWWDGKKVYLRPEETARWVSSQLRAAGRMKRPLSAKGISSALRSRGGDTGQRVQKTIAKKREWVWEVERGHLGSQWDGLLEP
jgi:hypothetical protein